MTSMKYNRHKLTPASLTLCALAALLTLGLCATAPAQDESAPEPEPEDEKTIINWTSKDIADQTVTIPDASQPTVVVFVRADQKRSIEMMKQAMSVLGASPDAQVIAVVSGEKANAEKLRDAAAWPWRLAADPAHKASGMMLVFAWPSTVVVDAKGVQIAHVGGLPDSFAKDLRAYLDFAHGRIDQDALTKRLQTHGVVSSSNQQVANRHLQMARRLLARGEVDPAQKEIAEALALLPNDVRLRLEMARVHLFRGDADAALAGLDKLPADTIAPWQANELRGQALVIQKQWDEAQAVLIAALKHNPRPAGTHYLLGQVYEKTGNPTKAAKHYRTAFEQTIEGRLLNRSPREARETLTVVADRQLFHPTVSRPDLLQPPRSSGRFFHGIPLSHHPKPLTLPMHELTMAPVEDRPRPPGMTGTGLAFSIKPGDIPDNRNSRYPGSPPWISGIPLNHLLAIFMDHIATLIEQIRANGHDIEVDEPASDDAIAECERRIGYQLPPSYVAFAKRYGWLSIYDNGVNGVDDLVECTNGVREDGALPDGFHVIRVHENGGYCLDFNRQRDDGECPVVNFERTTVQHKKPVSETFGQWLVDFNLEGWAKELA